MNFYEFLVIVGLVIVGLICFVFGCYLYDSKLYARRLDEIHEQVKDANSKLETLIRWGNRLEDELKTKTSSRFFRY